MSARVLAVDLGGAKLRAAPRPTSRMASVRRSAHGRRPRRAKHSDHARRPAARRRDRRFGLGVPGLAERARAAGSPTFPTSTASTLPARFPASTVALGNDAHFALLAEAMGGAAAGLSDAILLAIGTGIGSAVLADRAHRGGRARRRLLVRLGGRRPRRSGGRPERMARALSSGRALDDSPRRRLA